MKRRRFSSGCKPRPAPAPARKLLAEAGYPNGFELRLDVPTRRRSIDIAQSVQHTMALAGAKVNVVSADMQTGDRPLSRPSASQMVGWSWTPDYLNDPRAT